jgi:hypothetical protein
MKYLSLQAKECTATQFVAVLSSLQKTHFLLKKFIAVLKNLALGLYPLSNVFL